MGDLMDQAPGSVHPTEFSYTVEEEFNAAGAYLRRVADAAPLSSKHWLLGNHDHYYRDMDPRRVPRHFRSLLDWNRVIPSLLDWRQVPYENAPHSCLELGQVVFRHGFRTGGAAWTEDHQFNRWTGGHAHRLHVTGHTHSPRKPERVEVRRGLELDIWSANTGTLADWDKLHYAKRLDTSKWGQACLLIEARMGRSCLPTKQWDAELKVRRMFGQKE